MLHITNGDLASGVLKEAGVEGAMLAWADVLHEGPLPEGLTLAEMSQIRAGFIQSRGWATAMEAQLHFQTRDAILLSAAQSEEVVLWNSPELYDQLHLLQILNWYAGEGQAFGLPSVVFVPHLLAGSASPDQPWSVALAQRTPVTDAQLKEAAHVWQLVTCGNPRGLAQWVAAGSSSLPYMVAGMQRWLAEYPDAQGLSQTQRFMLEALAANEGLSPWGLFERVREKETMPFMGDASFWHLLQPLVEITQSAVLCNDAPHFMPPGLFEHDETFNNRVLSITPAGRALLDGSGDLLAQGVQERWLGGVCIQGTHSWRINRATGELFRG